MSRTKLRLNNRIKKNNHNRIIKVAFKASVICHQIEGRRFREKIGIHKKKTIKIKVEVVAEKGNHQPTYINLIWYAWTEKAELSSGRKR